MRNTITFECPPELLIGLHYDADQFARYVQFETAITLFKTGKITSGLAAKWLGIPRIQFLTQAFDAKAEFLENNDDDFRRETSV